MLSSGLLPAIEQLFRQVPVVSPAHVAAADLLVSPLMMVGGAELIGGPAQCTLLLCRILEHWMSWRCLDGVSTLGLVPAEYWPT